MGFIARAFTIGGGEAPEAVAQRQAGAERLAREAAEKSAALLKAPTPPQAPGAPPQFVAGTAPGVKERARATASTLLGAAATTGETAKKSVLG